MGPEEMRQGGEIKKKKKKKKHKAEHQSKKEG